MNDESVPPSGHRPPLSVREAVAILRRRYPGGLVCTTCAGLLATTPASYAARGFSEAARLAYVCAECRLEAAQADRLARARRANLGRARALRDAPLGPTQGGMCGPLREPAVYAGPRGVVSIYTQSPEGGPPASSRRRGGRPRIHATDTARRTAAQRAWRRRAGGSMDGPGAVDYHPSAAATGTAQPPPAGRAAHGPLDYPAN